MFTSIKTGPRNYPDYLTTNYFVSTSTLGQGDFAEVLKVQSKTNKEFYAIKKLRRTVQGAHERYFRDMIEENLLLFFLVETHAKLDVSID